MDKHNGDEAEPNPDETGSGQRARRESDEPSPFERQSRPLIKRRGGAYIAFGFIVVALAVAAAWYLISPKWTVSAMQNAADAGDNRALLAFIDMTAFKQDLAGRLGEQMMADDVTQNRLMVGPDASVAAAEQLAALMLLPDAISEAFRTNDHGELLPPGGLNARNMSLHYDSLNAFHLHEKGEAKGRGDLIFRRRGLVWRLSAINLRREKTDAEIAKILNDTDSTSLAELDEAAGVPRSVAPPPSAPPIITHELFARLTEGMTYNEVVNLLDMAGEEMSSSHVTGVNMIMYQWNNRDGGSITVMFQNDRLIAKSQFGLH